jgi:hypothetical protein
MSTTAGDSAKRTQMTKDELKKHIDSRISYAENQIEGYGDRDELIENVADNGNHDDTFTTGEDFGYFEGYRDALVEVGLALVETPDDEHNTN